MNAIIIINLVLLILLSGVMFLMVRQVALLVAQASPGGFRREADGPRIGERLPDDLWPLSRRRLQLVVFGSQHCSVCKQIKEAGLDPIAKSWSDSADVIYVDDDDVPDPLKSHYYYIVYGGIRIREMLNIPYVPFGLVVGEDGRVIQKGLINHPSHVENLLEISEGTIRVTKYTKYADQLA